MILKKAFKYRIYPTTEQEASLLRWDRTLRWLWNLAHEQRLMGQARPRGAGGKYAKESDERIFPSYFDQAKEMTLLCKEAPWLEEVPCAIRQEVLRDLDKAWQRCFKRLAWRPRFKRRTDTMRFYIPNRSGWDLTGETLRFRKLGDLKIVQDRPLGGTPSSCTIVRDVDQWFAIILCSIEREDPAPRSGPMVGIDRGVAFTLADSDGRLVMNPDFYGAAHQRLARAQRQVAKKQKGSKNQTKIKLRVAKLHRKVRRQREHFLHVESVRYAEKYGVIMLEDLHIGNMTRSASGTVEEPGTNVAAKSGLNRSILDAGWGRFHTYLRYKLDERGGRLLSVPAANTSRMCPKCGHVAMENRPDRETFRCVKCRHEAHADTNAAINIRCRGEQQISEAPKPKKQRVSIKIAGRKARDTAVKPTVVQPVEDSRKGPMKQEEVLVRGPTRVGEWDIREEPSEILE